MMDITIYQINMGRDYNRVAFQSYDGLERLQGTNEIDSELYDRVFEGKVECDDLEDVYRMFNVGQPEGYRGRSLSVSDVVETTDKETGECKWFYCDSIGFKQVTFDTDLVEESTNLLEGVKKKNSLFRRLRINGLRSIEDDLYEYRVRAKNAKTEDEAMYTLRQINTRLAILDDYIKYEDLDDSERERYIDVMNQFRDIREYLSTKKIYNRKNYGIWYDYDQLDKDTAE